MGAAAPFFMLTKKITFSKTFIITRTKSHFQNVYPCTIYYLCFNRTCYGDIVKYFKILELLNPAQLSMSRWDLHLSFRVKRHNKGEEMKKTETYAKTNAIIEATNSSQVSISEKLFFTYTDELVKAKLDLVGKTGQMLATIKAYIPLNMIDVQRVEYMAFEQILLQATEYYEKLLRTEILKVLEYYHNCPDYAAATIVSSICVYIFDEEKWIVKLFQELIDDPFAKLFFKKHAELGRQFYQDIECASDCVASLKGKLLALETQINEEFENKTLCVKVASELSHNLRLIIKSLDNKESSELFRGSKSNLQIYEMLKKGAQPLPENFKMCPTASAEVKQLSPETIKRLVGSTHFQSTSQVKKESTHPESIDQTKLDNPQGGSLKHSDSDRKIHIVGSNGDEVVR